MPDIDYDPVISPEDEEERKRREGDYPPAAPARSFDVGAAPEKVASHDASLAVSAAPVGPIMPRSTIPQIGGEAPPEVKQPRPTWSEYAPVQKHGIGRVGQVLGEMFLGTESKAERRAETAYKNATAEYEAPQAEAHTAAVTKELTAKAGEEEAHAKAESNPQPKQGLTPEETTLHDLMTGENGAPRVNPQTGKPYTYVEAYGAVKQAGLEAKPAQAPHITYDQGIPVSVTDGKKTFDINDPKLPPELKPLVDSANRAHGQHTQEAADQQARAFSQQSALVDKHKSADNEKDVRKQYDTARDADERLDRMQGSYKKALNGDQQAMLALLTDHIGMTLGLQKGARITKDILNEATNSQPWLAKVASKFDDRGFLSGVTLGPDQMKQMLGLGYEARNRQWNRAFGDSKMYQVPEPPGARETFKGDRKFDDDFKGGTGKTLSSQQLQQAAKDHNISIEEAKKQAEAQGYQIK